MTCISRPGSMFAIVFDEHGGFFDHVRPPPGVPPAPARIRGSRRTTFLSTASVCVSRLSLLHRMFRRGLSTIPNMTTRRY
ncbi:alkaline phosphatase family protein [Paraburkholderia sp. MM5496-R1]|uniref:alkaline phosphatase family protein n=1 Tax=Paraburkholderia sp. MM5496-R1 TaxID=2991065 RepID=UPI003D197013